MSDCPQPTPEGQTVSVLVVDDEREIRKVFAAALEQRGWDVRTAGSAREALQILMQHSFDVLVVDLKMQEMDGIVFLQEALKIWPSVGVIIVSGYVTDEAIEQAAALGVRHVLNKPVKLSDLCDQVQQQAQTARGMEEHIPTEKALILMRNHLNLLSRLGASTEDSESLFAALSDFGRALGTMMPADVVGILLREERPTLLLTPHTDVSREYLAAVETEMITRYTALSGRPVSGEALNLQIQGQPVRPDGPSAFGSTISVPVLLENEVRGLLTLTHSDAEVFSPSDISLLYHAANHISAAFTALRRMHHLATRDPLTGVFNRIRLEEELDRAWLVSRRYNYSMAVVIADIDHFKTLNDSYGHNVGDEVLRGFAHVLQGAARATDVVARFGGDEFVAILPRAEEHDARAFGERLLHRTREHAFGANSHQLNLTITIGIATSLSTAKPATGDELLSQADRALYTAKRAGRNRICVWPEAGAVADEEQPAEDADRQALPAADAAGAAGVLVVDDEESILDVVRAMLEKDGYSVTTCLSGNDALQAIRARPGGFDVLLTDLELPEMGGLELLGKVHEIDNTIIKVVLTGHATVDNAVRALREGAYDFIQKPVVRMQLSAMIKRAVEVRELKRENARHQAHLEEMVRKRSAQLASTLEEIRRSYEFTLEALVAMLDAREHQVGRHSLRTRDLAVMLAQRVGLVGEALQSVATGALLHDIGKIGIPDSVLLREGPLLPEHWEIMKQHPEIGYNILKSSPYLREAAKLVHQHQEFYDGSGYPQGLKGDQICIGARIFAVVDAYDAMRSARVYREPVSPEEAAAEVLAHSGTQFDPEIVRIFLECQEDFERVLSE